MKLILNVAKGNLTELTTKSVSDHPGVRSIGPPSQDVLGTQPPLSSAVLFTSAGADLAFFL